MPMVERNAGSEYATGGSRMFESAFQGHGYREGGGDAARRERARSVPVCFRCAVQCKPLRVLEYDSTRNPLAEPACRVTCRPPLPATDPTKCCSRTPTSRHPRYDRVLPECSGQVRGVETGGRLRCRGVKNYDSDSVRRPRSFRPRGGALVRSIPTAERQGSVNAGRCGIACMTTRFSTRSDSTAVPGRPSRRYPVRFT